jgi:hypothetical protein
MSDFDICDCDWFMMLLFSLNLDFRAGCFFKFELLIVRLKPVDLVRAIATPGMPLIHLRRSMRVGYFLFFEFSTPRVSLYMSLILSTNSFNS